MLKKKLNEEPLRTSPVQLQVRGGLNGVTNLSHVIV
jgi:hypothetical protein